MAEPSTTVVASVATATVGAASLFLDIDANALIGAFAGATLFVLSAKELHVWLRLLYMLISLVIGYMAAPEIIHNTFIQETGVAGFLGGLLCVTASQPILRYAETLDIAGLMRGGKK